MDRNDFQILTDDDLHRLLNMQDVLDIIEETLRLQDQGKLVHPPRAYFEAGEGALAFTIGASPEQESALGFRVYSMFKNDLGRAQQLVAVFDSNDGSFRGAVIGNAVGDMRTGAIGGLAVNYLSRPDARILGLIGSGHQAVTQLQAATLVRDFEKVVVYSRNADNRRAFIRRMSDELEMDIQDGDSAQAVVESADVLVCTTTSHTPVFDPEWIQPGTHINTVGPKLKNRHELPVEIALQADLISTDSVAQIQAFGDEYFLDGYSALDDYIPLSALATNAHPGRGSSDDITLFCSTGLAGTEVAVAAHALAKNKFVDE